MYALSRNDPSLLSTFTEAFTPINYRHLFAFENALPPIYENPYGFPYRSDSAFENELAYHPIGILVFLLLRRDGIIKIAYPDDLMRRLIDISLSDSASIPLNNLLPMDYWSYVAPTTHTVDRPLVTLESFLFDHFFHYVESHTALYARYEEAVRLIESSWDVNKMSVLKVRARSLDPYDLEDEALLCAYGPYLDNLHYQYERLGYAYSVTWSHPPRGGGFQCYLKS